LKISSIYRERDKENSALSLFYILFFVVFLRIENTFEQILNKKQIVMLKKISFILFCACLLSACSSGKTRSDDPASQANIPETTVAGLIKELGKSDNPLIEKGIRHTASLWRETDGTPDDFVKFCREYLIVDPVKKEEVFNRYCHYFESLYGHFNKL
jgi:hypothetical protein